MNEATDYTDRKRSGWLRINVALLLAVILISSASAQQTVSSATLSGRVQDPTGATVKRASVTIKNVETNFTCTCTCNEEGAFHFPSLAVGSYTIEIAAPGFALLQHKVTLSIGQRLDVSLKLTLKGLTETVSVSTDLPV